jgi:hypothetical protein
MTRGRSWVSMQYNSSAAFHLERAFIVIIDKYICNYIVCTVVPVSDRTTIPYQFLYNVLYMIV